jgi:hypothetical protein
MRASQRASVHWFKKLAYCLLDKVISTTRPEHIDEADSFKGGSTKNVSRETYHYPTYEIYMTQPFTPMLEGFERRL